MDDLAAILGMSKKTIYNVFSDKNSLFLDMVDYLFDTIKESEQKIVKDAVKTINESIEIPCTGCSYCTDGCPKHIAIPKYFSLYNADKQESKDKGWTPQGEYYDRLTHIFVLHAVSVSVSVHSIFRLLIILKKLPLILENKMFYKT